MNPVFTREGARSLAASWSALALAVIAGAAIVGGSHWYLDREKRESLQAERRLQEVRTRLEAARRERDNMQESADVYRTLVERGLLQSERRLELVELVNGLRSRHQLFALEYEISPQRPLQLTGGRVFNAIDVLASRVKLQLKALHEGDVLGFVEELVQSRQGFYPVDRCVMRRIEETTSGGLQPRIEAECSLEWITLRDRSGNRKG